jgi:large subunit ribosomal protein L35
VPKIKTHKGTAKRTRETSNGKILRRKAFGSHFLSKKSSARKRTITKIIKVDTTYEKSVKRQLGQ